MSQDVHVCQVNTVTQANKMAVESPENLTFTETKGDICVTLKQLKRKIDDENGREGNDVFMVMARRGS